MNRFLFRISRSGGGTQIRRIEHRLGGWTIRHRWSILWASLLFCGLGASGMSRLRFNSDTHIFFGPNNPQIKALTAFHQTFGDHENVTFTFAPRQGDIFTRATLNALVELTDAAEQIPFALRVYSLARHRHIRVEGEEILVEELISDPIRMSNHDRMEARRIALAEPLLVHQLVSADGNTASVFVRLALPAEDSGAATTIARKAHAVRDEFRQRYPNLEIHLTGTIMLEQAFKTAGKRDLYTLVPPMFLAMFLLIALALQSSMGMLATISVMLLAVASALGITGWLGIPLSIVSAGAPGLIITLSVADCVHIVSTMFQRIRDGASRQAAIAHSLRVNLLPVFLTSITTAIGFLSLNASESPPFRDLGNTVAIGVTTAFFYSIFLLPALLAILPTRAGPEQSATTRTLMRRLAGWIIRRERLLRTGLLAVAAAASLGLLRIELDTDIHEIYSRRLEIRRATDFHLDRMGTFTLLAYPMDSGAPGGIADPAYLDLLDRFARWYRTRPGVVHVSSVADMVKRIHRGMHNDDPDFEGIPNERASAAQYLFFYELSLPPGHRLDTEIDPAHTTTVVQVMAQRLTSRQIRALDTAAQAWLQAQAPPHLHSAGAGTPLVWAHLNYRNTRMMAVSTLGALVLISLIMIPALRNIRLGLLSLIPNVLPPLIAFGLWGFAVGHVGLPATVIAGMTIGIVVDDTIHFLSRYARARHARGMPPEEAIRHTFEHVGPAMITTSVALVGGFAVLALSPFGMTAVMGRLCVLIIALALALDLLLLPTLLLALERRWPTATPSPSGASRAAPESDGIHPARPPQPGGSDATDPLGT